jgi:hypothetical protein
MTLRSAPVRTGLFVKVTTFEREYTQLIEVYANEVEAATHADRMNAACSNRTPPPVYYTRPV